TVLGTGADPGSLVSLAIDAGAGPLVIGSTTASPSGTFAFADVPLAPGASSLIVQAADSAGNTSRKATIAVTRAPLPAAPADFATAVAGFDVNLGWSASADAIGYVLRRNGTLLTSVTDVASQGTASASSFYGNFPSYAPRRAIDGSLNTYWQPSYY